MKLGIVLLAGSVSAFSQTTASDDFERSGLGSNWSISFPADGSQVHILENSDLGMNPGPQGFFLADWVGVAFDADQFCEAVIPMDAAPDWARQVYVRRRAGDAARYGFGFDNDPAQVQYYRKWYFKYDGVPGPETRMFGVADHGPEGPGPGDTLRVEIRGYTLSGYWNGRLMATASDANAANRIANGVPGLAARLANGNAALTQAAKVWESWKGGNADAPTRILSLSGNRPLSLEYRSRAFDPRGRAIPHFPRLKPGNAQGWLIIR
jgi:hypothetical protein